jgi:hypothetical protein
MGWLSNLFLPKNTKTTDIVKSLWRNNMWVMAPRGIGIIFKLGEPCVVHYVGENGLTVGEEQLPLQQLRQALYLEIPENRRGDIDKARRLGYM